MQAPHTLYWVIVVVGQCTGEWDWPSVRGFEVGDEGGSGGCIGEQEWSVGGGCGQEVGYVSSEYFVLGMVVVVVGNGGGGGWDGGIVQWEQEMGYVGCEYFVLGCGKGQVLYR